MAEITVTVAVCYATKQLAERNQLHLLALLAYLGPFRGSSGRVGS